MANKRICLQIDYDGPQVVLTGDKRLTLLNVRRLLAGIDAGKQYRKEGTPNSVIAQTAIVQASATATCAAVAAADTLSIGGTALTATQLRASGTITCVSAVANDTITVNGTVFTGVNGAVTLGDATFDIRTSDTACAASIVAQVNAYGGALVSGIVGAKSAAGVVTIYAKARGTGGNSITLASSSNTTLAVSGAVLANGAAATNNHFDCIGTNTETAADIVRAIGVSTTAAIKAVSATSALGVVTVTAKAPGVAGNAVTFTSSNGTRLAVTGSGFLASGSAGAPTVWTF